MKHFSVTLRFFFKNIWAIIAFLTIPVILLALGLNSGGFINFFANYKSLNIQSFASFFNQFFNINWTSVIWLTAFVLLAPFFLCSFIVFINKKMRGERFNFQTILTTVRDSYFTAMLTCFLFLLVLLGTMAIMCSILLLGHGIIAGRGKPATISNVLLAIALFLIYIYANVALSSSIMLVCADLSFVGFSLAVAIRHSNRMYKQNRFTIISGVFWFLVIALGVYQLCTWLFALPHIIASSLVMFIVWSLSSIMLTIVYLKGNNTPIIETKKKKDYYQK